MKEYINTSFRLPRNIWRRMNRACNDISCFKGDWLRSAVEEKLEQSTDEQIERMVEKGKEST
jgi:predicted DNA-binding protein